MEITISPVHVVSLWRLGWGSSVFECLYHEIPVRGYWFRCNIKGDASMLMARRVSPFRKSVLASCSIGTSKIFL